MVSLETFQSLPPVGRRRGRIHSYSRFVRAARILLLVVAAGLVASILVLSRVDPLSQIPEFTAPFSGPVTGQAMTNPQFSGVTVMGDAYMLTASSANLDKSIPENINLVSPDAAISFRNGRTVHVTARQASLDTESRTVSLEGNVKFSVSTGYLVETERLDLFLGSGRVNIPGKVVAEGPAGRIVAGSMDFFRRRTGPGNELSGVLLFDDQVKLVYPH